MVPNLWSAAHNQVVRGCVYLLNKNDLLLWHCDITYKLVVCNLHIVGKVVLVCKKFGTTGIEEYTACASRLDEPTEPVNMLSKGGDLCIIHFGLNCFSVLNM